MPKDARVGKIRERRARSRLMGMAKKDSGEEGKSGRSAPKLKRARPEKKNRLREKYQVEETDKSVGTRRLVEFLKNSKGGLVGTERCDSWRLAKELTSRGKQKKQPDRGAAREILGDAKSFKKKEDEKER